MLGTLLVLEQKQNLFLQAFLWYFKIGGDQKWPHIIFMYKNMFFMLFLEKIEIRGWKKIYLIFDHLLF